ncbi:cysteate racemase [Pectinatus sottacetonis]|uniref:aspartate/glutamate racemase family protein n=1 Tax=Pectinatus sottacetonis TaxID=1002795 RepID=UPI0018C51D07|nr:amino acid racemase [Pectinatus sottacetonis]
MAGKSIGILGGMGPAATCDLMQKIISMTDATKDQQHIHIYVDCNTNIPDRTDAILHNGKNPIPEMVKSGIKLQSNGADVLIMPCNTAHFFYDEIVKYFDIPVLHMPRETVKILNKRKIKKVGLLATDGTIQSGVYKNVLDEGNIQCIYPNKEEQNIIMNLIYSYIKKGIIAYNLLPIEKVVNVIDNLNMRGAENIILGCTELL